ncbi:MAG: CAP domain-containing protein [Phenylobacterium sp.]|uniref:CAP domain-containing protein n=1 Tax=Phenylobacterium sp. TaxID=1871053 RepID=UPI00273775CD|nr:CAP domain-containing protein [Phenylobacterium sp.]MDP3748838.1 CAP domain-containing protein [Phenylobacterium sp.]
MGRRALLTGLAGLAATPAFAAIPGQSWLDYEIRLRARLADAGAFDPVAEREILRLTNAVRAERGATPCAWSDELALAARAHAGDLAARAYVEHVSPEGFDPSHRVSILARRMIGSASENIAYRRADTPTTPAELMAIWRKSPPHWGNLLRPTHARVGIGVAVRGDRTYAVGLYSRPDGELGAPVPFRLGREADLAGAISQASPHIDGFAVSNPVDTTTVPQMAEGAAPVLAPGVYQLRPQRRLDARRYQVLWGPIFVRV